MPINPKYVAGLREQEIRKQKALLLKSKKEYEEKGTVTARPTVNSAETPRSTHAEKFERKYGFKVSDKKRVRSLFPDTDIDKIISKGIGAYGSSGSRPNVNPQQWAYARLASVLTGANALKVDKDLVGPKSLAVIKG